MGLFILFVEYDNPSAALGFRKHFMQPTRKCKCLISRGPREVRLVTAPEFVCCTKNGRQAHLKLRRACGYVFLRRYKIPSWLFNKRRRRAFQVSVLWLPNP
jgi:hypothetical protein